MISSQDIFTPQRLNCTLDIFFILGILLGISVEAAAEGASLTESFS